MAKVLVSFDDKLLKRIDRAAHSKGLSRSAYLAGLAEGGISEQIGPGKSRSVRGAMRKLDRLFERAPAGDSTAAVRAERDAR
jgi:metal-responsive CopG/Arc/MetJ family transcriptional regulator